MYTENTDGKYDEYFAAYKTFAINMAKLMARENGGNGPDDAALEAAWNIVLQIETKVAEVKCVYSLYTHCLLYTSDAADE